VQFKLLAQRLNLNRAMIEIFDWWCEARVRSMLRLKPTGAGVAVFDRQKRREHVSYATRYRQQLLEEQVRELLLHDEIRAANWSKCLLLIRLAQGETSGAARAESKREDGSRRNTERWSIIVGDSDFFDDASCRACANTAARVEEGEFARERASNAVELYTITGESGGKWFRQVACRFDLNDPDHRTRGKLATIAM
jgi:hypothetical protein